VMGRHKRPALSLQPRPERRTADEGRDVDEGFGIDAVNNAIKQFYENKNDRFPECLYATLFRS